MLYTILRIPKMTADFQRDLRNKNDQEKVKAQQKEAMDRLRYYGITDERKQKSFNLEQIEHFERLNDVENKMKVLFDESKIKQELTTALTSKSNSPRKNKLIILDKN